VKIALVDPLGYTTPYDHRLASALAERGHDVHLLTAPFLLDRPPEPDAYTREELFVPVASRLLRRAPRARARKLVKGFEYLPSIRRLLRRVDSLDPDVVHVQWLVRPELDLRWLRKVARERPTALTAHNAAPRRTRALDAWREALETVARVVVHSPQTADRIAELGIDRGKTTLIRHPVFDAPVERAVVPPSGSTMLFFGLIRRYKGLDLLVSALPRILEAAPDARLIVAGDPLDPVDPTRSLASSLGVEHAIDWRLGFLPEPELPALLEQSAFVVLPYRVIESSGVLALALGHGRPAVVSDLGAVGDSVREFEAGRAVASEDVDALAAACSELLTDGDALLRAYEGALVARRTLTWSVAAQEHERMYEEVTGRVPAEATTS
jgi:glycosyltransferase involved in cell wall biosynthesis